MLLKSRLPEIGRIEGECGILEEHYDTSDSPTEGYNFTHPDLNSLEAERRLKDIVNCFEKEKFALKELNKSPETIIWAMRLSMVRKGL